MLTIYTAKQVSGFNHRVVNPGYIQAGWRLTITRKPAVQLILQPQFTDNPQNICEGVITNAVQSCSKELPCLNGDSLAHEGCQCVVVVLAGCVSRVDL